MKLITGIDISGFRSINKGKLEHLGSLNAIAGLNNSGKSNVLRALNLFFTGQSDQNLNINIESDYHRGPNAPKGKKKRIRVALNFSLPSNFKFQKTIKNVESFLGGSTFSIAKEWTLDSLTPSLELNGKEINDLDEREYINRFLSLISFRYIPNRVLPLEIIRSEHHALRDVIVRRMAGKTIDQEKAFQALEQISVSLTQDLSKHVREACPGIGEVKLATPRSLQDMVFAFGYRLGSGEHETDDKFQGSGIQSLLMLETLALIDRDYNRKFGWKQATVWALEEPESSLHTALEAQVARYLADVSSEENGRLQIFSTTHSDLVLQYSDQPILVSHEDGASSLSAPTSKLEALHEAARTGISRWVHPILSFPLDPVIFVEGKHDKAFIEAALRISAPDSVFRVATLEELQGGGATGGIDDMIKYLKTHMPAIRTRLKTAPIVVVLDWDSLSRKKDIEKLFHGLDCAHVVVWDESSANPHLDDTFRGVERFYPDRIIDEVDQALGVLGVLKGKRFLPKKDAPNFKNRAFDLVRKGLLEDDLKYAKAFLEALLSACGVANSGA
ncbi:ATP-binding protein [Aggregicoccus sp. 17bor-14]|uniref:ATP-dependent nuclease n=1 Tax=Myxococcaceae TaxID=31 RepID=UPI00129D0FC2|nr:AAA family ATPase [Simulacricoccus sp. 17bor-14]MRI87665.1 ATP-binding protein [Aggregicoccus sp. 17bor-14]